MVEPYFQDNSTQIFLGDSREIIPQLQQPDIVLTDPPYGIEYQSGHQEKWNQFAKIYGDNEFPLWIFDMLKPKIAIFIFCRWNNLYELPRPKSFIVWDKGYGTGSGDLKHEYTRQWEAIAFYPGTSHLFTSRPADIIHCDCIPAVLLKHPNEKPVSMLQYLIASHPKGIVLDPFCGTGSTLRAAKNLGRKSIGIEINEDYARIAVEQMQQSILDLEVGQIKQNTSEEIPDVTARQGKLF